MGMTSQGPPPENNLRRWREQRGWTLEEMADVTGLTAATLSRIENRKIAPSVNTIITICNIFGAGVHDFFAIGNVSAAELGHRRIPVLDYVQAGSFSGVAPYIRDEEMTDYVLTDERDYSADTFAMNIRGDSMEPEFLAGDKVIIDPTVAPHPGDFVVAKDASSGEATFKRYRPKGLNDAGKEYFVLEPLNPNYPPLRSDFQEIRIVGVMMEHRKKRRR